MAELQIIPPADLLIDEQNPRISDPNEGQHRALQLLAEHLGPKLKALAVHIVANGINPADLPIVMALPDQSRYTVLEGNRRLAALRALENPESISGAVAPGILKKIRQLSRDYLANPVEEINCVVMRDRDEARPWIELRHTGENEGAGLVPWGSDESARFRSRTGIAEAHLQALDFLQERGDLTPEVRKKLPTTSFKRLIETPVVRSKLGVEVLGGVLRLRADVDSVSRALMHVVNDLASRRIKVGDIYRKEHRERYASKLPARVVVKPTIPSGQGLPVSAKTAGSSTKRKTRKQSRAAKKRDRLIPPDCVLAIPPGRISDIYVELRKKLSLESHTNAVSVLFRVFVELTVDAYINDNSISGVKTDDKLRKKIEKVAIDLESKKKLNKQQARAIRSANLEHSFLAPGVATMNDYVHNKYIFPAPTDLRQHWNSLQAFIAAMWAT